jgi:hypothetical protein
VVVNQKVETNKRIKKMMLRKALEAILRHRILILLKRHLINQQHQLLVKQSKNEEKLQQKQKL